jgi:hypothetical protein
VLEVRLAGIAAPELTQMHDGVLQMLGNRALAPGITRRGLPRGESPSDDAFDGRKRQRKAPLSAPVRRSCVGPLLSATHVMRLRVWASGQVSRAARA